MDRVLCKAVRKGTVPPCSFCEGPLAAKRHRDFRAVQADRTEFMADHADAHGGYQRTVVAEFEAECESCALPLLRATSRVP